MKKILVPTDFSQPALVATGVAADIAQKAYAKIVLLHVIDLPGKESFNTTGEIDATGNWGNKMFTLKLIEKAKAQLEAAAAGLKAKNIEVDQVLRLGNPYHGISVMITEQDVDLVVMGTSDRSKLEEIIAGSNTEKVIRHAHCLVLTVHARTGKRDFKNIVYATALVEDEKPFAELIINTQKIFDSTLHIVRVNTPTNFQPDSAVKFVMQNFARKSNLKNYTLNVYNDYTEEQGIIHFAESINADLIAIATHGRTGFAHTLAGSIAEEVASHSRRPVLTFVNK